LGLERYHVAFRKLRRKGKRKRKLRNRNSLRRNLGRRMLIQSFLKYWSD
jgi:hypothetical protein